MRTETRCPLYIRGPRRLCSVNQHRAPARLRRAPWTSHHSLAYQATRPAVRASLIGALESPLHVSRVPDEGATPVTITDLRPFAH